MPDSERTRTRLLAVITTILMIAALKLAEPVIVPVIVAVFLIMLAWPMQQALERLLPRWLALILTVLALLLSLGIIAGGFAWSLGEVADRAPQLQERFDELRSRFLAWLRGLPIPVPAGLGEQMGDGILPQIQRVAQAVYSTTVLLGLVLAFLILGMLEVRDFEVKVEGRLRGRLGDELLDTAGEIAVKVRRHMLALTITSAVSGVATYLYALALGLEFAALWGITAFLLNYIPTIGPTLAVFPPTLYSFLQFDGLGRPLAVFAGMGAIEFFIGNFVDPKIEGRVLSLSPVVVLFAIVFWGWMWGVLGALLAVPIMAALVIVADQFPGTRWIAALMSGMRSKERESANEKRSG